MVLGALLLLASPYLSYKIAFGQIFEAVSTTASGWMGALTATGIEVAGVSYGSALQRQASETRIEGQAQSETARARRREKKPATYPPARNKSPDCNPLLPVVRNRWAQLRVVIKWPCA